jgi:hypothetical protein
MVLSASLRMEPLVIAPHAALTTAEVVALGGWHPRYARVIAVASAGDHGFALVDGNGDGSELEAEHWLWSQGSWQPGGSSGAGPLDTVGPLHSGGHAGDSAWFAYGSAPGQDTVIIAFDGRSHQVPVGSYGLWAFTGIRAGPGRRDEPALAS